MPRPKKEAGIEPKKRSRTGCWPCKARKVKCGEEKPACANCTKSGETCDYSIRLNWGGRSRKDRDGTPVDSGSFTFVATPTSTAAGGKAKSNGHGHEHVFSAQHIATAPSRPPSSHPANLPTPDQTPSGDVASLDPRLHLAQGQYRAQDAKPPNASLTALLRTDHDSPASAGQTSPKSAPAGEDFSWSSPNSAKRVKLSPPGAQAVPVFAIPHYPPQNDHSPALTHFTPHSISSIVNTPATPNSSINSGSPYPSQPAALNIQDPPDLRRLSVKSLLSDPEEESPPAPSKFDNHGNRIYGYDHGFEDLDVPRNDDTNVIHPRSPDLRRPSGTISDHSTSSGEEAKQIAFEPGGYYAQPVPIKIPRSLEPLPPELLDNQMNLLYFHHFINHTGRIMVTHDCPENPFRGVLPQMAVRNPHLLHLLLAYSASHRAKLLKHPEPANRIAEWMSDVLPALRQALNEPSSPGSSVSDSADPSPLAPLATAIMLASYEIMLPNSFSVRIPWQKHLAVAREMIVAKGGLDHLAKQANGLRDKAIFFLSRWFAYIDVLGSLSNRNEQPLFGAYLEDGGGLWLVNRDDEEIYQIDCFFGFSGRCIALLAQVAELTATCDNERIDPITNQVKAGWTPPPYFRKSAEELQQRLLASATTVFQGCMHNHPHAAGDGSHQEDDFDTATNYEEMYATNAAYHYAGLIHLSRRVLALPPSSPEVQMSVQKILGCLEKVRRGSSAESCLLFPMFTAGCEALHESQRQQFMDRLRDVEGWGMQHVGRLRQIMQTVWDTGKPWETLVDGEFFG